MNDNLDLHVRITGDSAAAVRAAREAEQSIRGIQEQCSSAARESKALANAMSSIKGAIGGFFVFQAFKRLATDLINTNITMESLRVQLTSVTGTVEEGARAFQNLTRFAADTPFEVEGLTKAFISLKNYGIEPTQQVMQAITDQSSKLGASQETLEGIVTALGQSWAKGKLQAEEMMQLAERGVPVYDLLSKSLGVSTTALQDMAQKGQLTRDAINQLITEMGRLASGSNARAMDTLNGKISNLADSWHTFEDALLNDKSEGIIKSIVSNITIKLNLLKRNLNSTIDDQIAHAQARIDTFNSLGGFGKTVADFAGYDIGVEYNKRDSLKNLKAKQDAAAEQADISAKSRAAISQTQDWLDELNSAEAKSAAKSVTHARTRATAVESTAQRAAKAYANERDAIKQNIDNLEFELNSLKLSEGERGIQQRLRAESAKATSAERIQIEALIRAIDAETEAKKRQQSMWDQSVKDANELYDLKQRVSQFSGSNDISASSFSNTLGDIQDTGKSLGLNDQQMKELYDKAGKAFNDGFITPAKDGVSELSEFSKQAAHNMQTSFADFLFDPFSKGADGMLKGFGDTIKRMAAEAASAQIFNALFGANFGKTGEIGGLLKAGGSLISSGGSWITSALGKFIGFANGGIMSSAGPIPLHAYASGGIANKPQVALFGEGRMNEAYVPLPDGRSIPVTMNGKSGGGNVFNVSINVEGGNNPDVTGKKIGEAFIRTIARDEIFNQTRAGNRLNPKTRF